MDFVERSLGKQLMDSTLAIEVDQSSDQQSSLTLRHGDDLIDVGCGSKKCQLPHWKERTGALRVRKGQLKR